MFADQKPVGVIEAKKENDGHKLTAVEEQSAGYAGSKLKHLNDDPLSFVYESTGTITHFTDYRDPKPRAREVFTCYRPETFRKMLIESNGVTKSLKTDSRSLERKPTVPLKDLLGAVAVGARDEDLFTSLASRLIRLEMQLTEKEKEQFQQKANGESLKQVAKALLDAYDSDRIEAVVRIRFDIPLEFSPEPAQMDVIQQEFIQKAAVVFTGELNSYIENVRKVHEHPRTRSKIRLNFLN